MMRPSLTRAIKWVFKGSRYEWVVDGFSEALPKVSSNLDKKAASAVVHGDAHETTNRHGQVVDPLHVSGLIFTDKGGKLCSFHAYPNGKIVFSRKKYGEVYFTPTNTEASTLATGLIWTMDDTGKMALYYDGKAWQQGQWSDQHGKWVALFDGVWYAWH